MRGRPFGRPTASRVVFLFAGLEALFLLWLETSFRQSLIPPLAREAVWFGGEGQGVQDLLLYGNLALALLLWISFRLDGRRGVDRRWGFVAGGLALAGLQLVCLVLSGGPAYVLERLASP